MKTSTLFTVLFAIFFVSCTRFSAGFPSRLGKAQSLVESQRDSVQEIFDGSGVDEESLPCVDEGDQYACRFYIIMLDACDTDVPTMKKLCRFTCNFC